jgi:hypothetical protein
MITHAMWINLTTWWSAKAFLSFSKLDFIFFTLEQNLSIFDF